MQAKTPQPDKPEKSKIMSIIIEGKNKRNNMQGARHIKGPSIRYVSTFYGWRGQNWGNSDDGQVWKSANIVKGGVKNREKMPTYFMDGP